MSGVSLTQKQLTKTYLDRLAHKVFRRRAINILGNTPGYIIVLDAARERTYNQIIARHLREARDREAEGKPPTPVQEYAKNLREKEERNDEETLRHFPEYSSVERDRMQTIIEERESARGEADRAEEERDLPPYTIPAPPYRERKTPWRTLKSKMTKTFFGRRNKSLSPTPAYYSASPPRYSDIEVGGRKSSGRKSSGRRKKSRRKTRKVRRH